MCMFCFTEAGKLFNSKMSVWIGGTWDARVSTAQPSSNCLCNAATYATLVHDEVGVE